MSDATVERDRLITRHGRDPHALVQLLREAQTIYGWLPRAILAHLAQTLKLELARVEGVASFYRFFHTRPVGRYRIAVQRQHHRPHARQPGVDGRPVHTSGRRGRPDPRRWAGQCHHVLLYRLVRSGPGAAGQPPPCRHPARWRTNCATGRTGAATSAGGAMARALVRGARQHSPRRCAARPAAGTRHRDPGCDRARCPRHAGRNYHLPTARARWHRFVHRTQVDLVPRCAWHGHATWRATQTKANQALSRTGC